RPNRFLIKRKKPDRCSGFLVTEGDLLVALWIITFLSRGSSFFLMITFARSLSESRFFLMTVVSSAFAGIDAGTLRTKIAAITNAKIRIVILLFSKRGLNIRSESVARPSQDPPLTTAAGTKRKSEAPRCYCFLAPSDNALAPVTFPTFAFVRTAHQSRNRQKPKDLHAHSTVSQSRYLPGLVSVSANHSSRGADAATAARMREQYRWRACSNRDPLAPVLIAAAIAMTVPMKPCTRLKRPVPVVMSATIRTVSTVTA